MINFKEEILDAIASNNKSTEDVDYVILNEYQLTSDSNAEYVPSEIEFDHLLEVADGIIYDDGYGTVIIDDSLKIVFKDGTYMDRKEYDGSEWFEFHSTPARPSNKYKEENLRSLLISKGEEEDEDELFPE